MSKDYNTLCEEYVESLDRDVDTGEIDELEKRISELEDERAEYIQEYGEDDVLVERVDDELDELKQKLEDIKQAASQTEQLKEKVLKRTASEFIAEDSFITEESLEALNHAFTGNRASTLLIEDEEITPETELEGNIRHISHTIRKLAMAKLDTDDGLKDSWESIDDSTKYEPMIIVAGAQKPLTPSQVAEKMEEQVDCGTVGTRLRNSIHQLDFTPYHRVDGDYMLSTIGDVMIQEYEGEIDSNNDPDSSSETESTEESGQEESENDLQVTLDSTSKDND